MTLAETTRRGVRADARRAGEHDGDVYAVLIQQIQAGDRSALEDLLAHARGVACRFSVLVCGAAPDALDTMQDAISQQCSQSGATNEPRV